MSAVRASGAGHDHTVFSARLSNLGDLMSPKCRRSPEILCGHHRCFHVSCRLAVSEVRLALPNFYNITIGIANVAARLAVLVLWLCDKLGSSTSP